ncbi:DUF3800 domain-containing protein [Undibacterium sp. Ji83W]|uniref:DUF3800 domain-containing protein n=1 Tax=Undibacterium sp. Ji83W TaxID=3413043 RepID=UPI003BF03E6E
MKTNLEQQRQMMVRMFQLRRVDEKFTFYYDETNNIRKFYLTNTGANVAEYKNFILGGIVLEEGKSIPDFSSLRSKLGMQLNAPEIKFSHIAKGDFEQVLSSYKLNIVLSWIIENDIFIHYSSVNIIYWAIVDIIDSILAEAKFAIYEQYRQPLKNELYRVANLDISAFLAMLKAHHYPDIQPGKSADFIMDLAAFLDIHSTENDNLSTLMLKELIRKSEKLAELIFLVDEEEGMLIKSFSGFYIRPIMLFKNATHIFDHEFQIENNLNGSNFKNVSSQIKFSFSDSKSEPGIQLADVITGFLGKYQNFVEENSLSDLLKCKILWDEKQSANFALLRQLIDTSDDVSNAFIHRTTAMDSQWKNDAFMHDLPPMSHLL